MKKKEKTTILYLRAAKAGNTTCYHSKIIGDKPDEEMAERGVEILLEYIKHIRRIN